MEDLIINIENQILKCQKSLLNKKITILNKKYLSGMIDAYSRIIFEIEINYKNK